MQSLKVFQDEGSAPIGPEGVLPKGGDGEGDGNATGGLDGGVTTIPEEFEEQFIAMLEEEENIRGILNFVESYAKEHQLQDKMSITPSRQGIEVVLPEVMLFPSGQAELIEEAILFLDDMALLLADISNVIQVEGHTDNKPISTARLPSNWDLSTARSNQVIRYLIEEHGLNPEQFKSVGYGEYQPIASNDTAEGRSKNRRVVLIITNKDVPL